MGIHTYLRSESLDLPGLTDYLDRLTAAARLREIRSLGAREQAKLFDATAGRPIGLGHFVPEGTPPLSPVVHHGRNSLAALHDFEKRFCLPDARSDELWGYNQHALRPLIGPGYFVARQGSHGTVEIDYSHTPPGKPASWPPIQPNSARLGRLIYYRTLDLVRGVSEHVAIGRVTRNGRPVDAWFVLCRTEN
jgi:hypothetical protein